MHLNRQMKNGFLSRTIIPIKPGLSDYIEQIAGFFIYSAYRKIFRERA